MASEYYGRSMSIRDAIRACAPGRKGTSLAQLAEVAEKFGFRTLMARLPIRHLNRVKLPGIAYWKNSHFVVIEEVSRKEVQVVDPNIGRLTYSVQEFADGWSLEGDEGIVLLLEPAQEFKPSETNTTTGLRFFLAYVSGSWSQIAQVLTSILLGSGLQLAIAYTTRALVDVAIQQRSMSFVYVVLMAQLTMFATRAFNDFLRSWIVVHLSAATNVSILADFLKKLMRVPFVAFEARTVGDILQRVGDNSRIQSFLTSTTVNGIAAVGNLVVYGIALLLLNRPIALVFLFTSALLGIWSYIFIPKRRILDNQRFEQSSKLQTSLVQILGGNRDIRLATAERTKREEWEKLQSRQFRLNLAGLSLGQWQQGGGMAIGQLRSILVSCISAAAVVHGHMTLGTMLALAYMVGAVSGPVDQIVSLFQSAQDAKISADRVAEIHALPSDLGAVGAPVPSDLSISLQGLFFKYRTDSPTVLRGLNLDIPQGTRLAIVGPSGSGKTTLMKLLTKLYAPTMGEITVGGVSLDEIDTTEWRQRGGVVPQDGFIFSDTLAANVALGFDDVDPERLRHAIETAVLTEVVARLPDGIHSKIGQYGSDLSAGERQRVLIARAIYKQPEVLIFDEATSALDGEIERTVLNNLDRELHGRTVITIAHRLSTVMSADRIALLDHGQIVE
ncbi:MAG TPA: peptidase domain-containing ABC transporter, partial [Thermoanaerobaculia bacterium]